VAVASDHVIESFRNDLYAGYKSSEGMDPVLLQQIPIMEDLLVAAGFTTWAMVEWEADDALAAAAQVADADERVEQVLIVTPDKDLGQCVRGTRVVQYDRRKDEIVDEAAVELKFGVGPGSIADYLALVGDAADGFPGLPGWGAKSASTVLAKFGSIADIPASSGDWGLPALRGAEKLARTLQDQMADALLFKVIATTATDVPVGTVDDWCWRGPTPALAALAAGLGAPDLAERARRVWERASARAAGAGA
jgi:5'-3' exonuclease